MRKHTIALMIVCICLISTTSVLATITPSTLNATLRPGQSVSEHKIVFLPGTIPKGDVIFAIDCTGSMSGAIATTKTQAINIMNTIGTLISDCQFGLMSFMDYPHSYDSFGYSATYGAASSGDYAYKLNQPITSDTTTVSNAINALYIGYGVDAPQDYARIIFESYSDTTIGWRTGARHIVIILGDSVPHYENLNEGILGNSSLPNWPGNYSTGGDPGRDEVMFTADDIYLPSALQAMATNQITLLYVKCHGYAFPDDTSNMMYWNYWTGITGGAAYGISDASNVPTAIQALVSGKATHVNKLTLRAQTGYEAWLTSVSPSEYDDITIATAGVNEAFDIVIEVPLGTVAGSHVFNITADADGASYGEEQVNIRVLPTEVHDVAVTDVSPVSDWVYQGILCHCTINVTVTNNGSFPEDFPVTVFAYNDSSGNYTVGTQSVTGMQPGSTMTLTFLWNTAGVPVCHWYNITAVALLGTDVSPADNTLSSPMLVKVRIIGDTNGDGKVDLLDLTAVANAYRSFAGDPRWNEACDIDNNGVVGLSDVVTVGIHYGQHCP
jgi:hypothetical protein